MRDILKTIQRALIGLVYGLHLLWALLLWLCGQSGNIMLGIILIVLYRISLWTAPFAITVLCWIPLTKDVPLRKRIWQYLLLMLLCGVLFLLCRLLFGNWF